MLLVAIEKDKAFVRIYSFWDNSHRDLFPDWVKEIEHYEAGPHPCIGVPMTNTTEAMHKAAALIHYAYAQQDNELITDANMLMRALVVYIQEQEEQEQYDNSIE